MPVNRMELLNINVKERESNNVQNMASRHYSSCRNENSKCQTQFMHSENRSLHVIKRERDEKDEKYNCRAFAVSGARAARPDL